MLACRIWRPRSYPELNAPGMSNSLSSAMLAPPAVQAAVVPPDQGVLAAVEAAVVARDERVVGEAHAAGRRERAPAGLRRLRLVARLPAAEVVARDVRQARKGVAPCVRRVDRLPSAGLPDVAEQPGDGVGRLLPHAPGADGRVLAKPCHAHEARPLVVDLLRRHALPEPQQIGGVAATAQRTARSRAPIQRLQALPNAPLVSGVVLDAARVGHELPQRGDALLAEPEVRGDVLLELLARRLLLRDGGVGGVALRGGGLALTAVGHFRAAHRGGAADDAGRDCTPYSPR